jgi:NAD(P)-dependent dehydrogenase (short-subunit alcohol dehydrogenase family)
MNSDHLGRNAMANSKDVVVTGVSTGIGWGTTKALVAEGFRVFGSVRKQADADRLQKDFGNGFVPLIMDAVVPQRFKNWTLPRLLPVRMLDAGLAKALGLTKP